MKSLTLAVIFHELILDAAAFQLTRQPIKQQSRNRFQPKNLHVPLFAEAGSDEGDVAKPKADDAGDSPTEGGAVKALAAAPSPTSESDEQDTESSVSEENAVSSQVFMITQEMKRTMIEDLGFKRKEVDSIRLELVANILENRVRCPSEGMPADWVDLDRVAANESAQEASSMMAKLENESKYPLKFPLLGVSLILFGKGFSDALITLIKVNIDFPGASLTATFQGIPVLAIDFVCVLAGAGIGLWTFKTMK